MKLVMRPVGEPVSEPVTLGQLRDHVRADEELDDAALLGFGVSARQLIQQWLNRPILPQTVRGICESWPCSGSIELAMPVTSVDAVLYTAADGVETPWTTGWIARTSQGGVTQVRPATGGSWPTLGADPLVTIEATAGFGSAVGGVPETIITAICKLAGYMHADRDGMGPSGYGNGRLPDDLADMIRPWRFMLLA